MNQLPFEPTGAFLDRLRREEARRVRNLVIGAVGVATLAGLLAAIFLGLL